MTLELDENGKSWNVNCGHKVKADLEPLQDGRGDLCEGGPAKPWRQRCQD